MNNKKIILCIIFFISGCNNTETGYGTNYTKYIIPNETLIYCQSAVNSPSEILFYASKKTDSNFDNSLLDENFKSYYITDVNNITYSINNYEFDNYSCYNIK